MKVFVEDNMDIQAPKAKTGRNSKASSTRRSTHSSGFKRRKPTTDLDALVNSGADGTEQPLTAESIGAEMPPPQRYIQPTNIVESSEPEGSDGFSSIPVSSYNFGFTEVTPTEPTSEPAPTQEESQAVPESPPKQSTSDTGGPSADIEEPPRPQQKRLNLGAVGRQSAQDKHSTVQSQETGPATSGQRGRTARVKGKPSNKQSMTRGGKYASNRKFKEPKPSKMKTPMPNAPAKNPTVIPVPESIGSQIVTLLEVVAGAALMFFGATQVGNILINNIVQGMLGG